MPTKRTHIARQQIVQPNGYDMMIAYSKWLAESWELRRAGPVRVPREYLGYTWSPSSVVGKCTESESKQG